MWQQRKAGIVPSFLQPLDHPIPMVATTDIGSTAAELLHESWTGLRIVELEGPRRYSANDVAVGFAKAVGHPVQMEPVPRETWEALFRSQGMKHPLARIRMIDGFNQGWIDFERMARSTASANRSKPSLRTSPTQGTQGHWPTLRTASMSALRPTMWVRQ